MSLCNTILLYKNAVASGIPSKLETGPEWLMQM